MDTNNQPYVIEGGQTGRARLNILSQTLEATTLVFITRVGIEPGMKVLDVGSGGGDVTRLLGQWVGAHGRVIGIDYDPEIVDLAAAEARAAGLDQVSFHVGNIFELEMEALFDLIYMRFLLTHLSDPADALGRLVRALKPGGVLMVEDIEMSGCFCYPASSAFDMGRQLYRTTVQRKGGDPDIGPKLPGYLVAAGLQDVQIDLVQPVFTRGTGKTMMSLTLQRMMSAILSEELGSISEIEALVAEIAAFEARPDTLVSLPRIFQVWGRHG